MELCLRDNDPTKTLLITPSGEELYKIESPPRSGGVTTVRRFTRNTSIGLISSEVGKIEPLHPSGTRLILCAEDLKIYLRPSIDDKLGSSWAFAGPDGQQYKWLIFISQPVLVRGDNSLTPIARFRRAKIGIVSRSRRACLEILPAGLNMVDFVVVTFVSFAKHTLAVKEPPHNPA